MLCDQLEAFPEDVVALSFQSVVFGLALRQVFLQVPQGTFFFVVFELTLLVLRKDLHVGVCLGQLVSDEGYFGAYLPFLSGEYRDLFVVEGVADLGVLQVPTVVPVGLRVS